MIIKPSEEIEDRNHGNKEITWWWLTDFNDWNDFEVRTADFRLETDQMVYFTVTMSHMIISSNFFGIRLTKSLTLTLSVWVWVWVWDEMNEFVIQT